MWGVTRENRISNQTIRDIFSVAQTGEKSLRWFSHVMRRDHLDAVRTVMEINVERKRRKVILKNISINRIENEMKNKR